jgi:cephalosporin hydroxylase
MEDWNKST